MRLIPALMAVLAAATVANAALAAPTAYYNPADGSIRLRNDRSFPLFLAVLRSPSGKLTGAPLSIPGTTHDFDDQPTFVAYFGLPPSTSDPSTWWNVGAVVPGGGALNALDLQAGYFVNVSSTEQPFSWIEIPEPTSALLGGLSIAALVAVNRRRTCSAT